MRRLLFRFSRPKKHIEFFSFPAPEKDCVQSGQGQGEGERVPNIGPRCELGRRGCEKRRREVKPLGRRGPCPKVSWRSQPGPNARLKKSTVKRSVAAGQKSIRNTTTRAHPSPNASFNSPAVRRKRRAFVGPAVRACGHAAVRACWACSGASPCMCVLGFCLGGLFVRAGSLPCVRAGRVGELVTQVTEVWAMGTDCIESPEN